MRSRPDGLVQRITNYADKECEIVTEVIECYQDRMYAPLTARVTADKPMANCDAGTSCCDGIVWWTRTRANGLPADGTLLYPLLFAVCLYIALSDLGCVACSPGEVVEILYEGRSKRVVYFAPGARTDGLQRREDTLVGARFTYVVGGVCLFCISYVCDAEPRVLQGAQRQAAISIDHILARAHS